MEIGNSLNFQKLMPQEPKSPPGGNIENRQPPPPPQKTEGSDPLSIYINSIDSEEGSAIKSSLQSLSVDGQLSLKSALEDFRSEAQGASQEEREKGFLEILNKIFSEYGGDTGATSALLSGYA